MPRNKAISAGDDPEPGKPRTTRQLVYQGLVRKISDGELPTGVPIYEVPISKEFGVSRTPVREAISQLVVEGVLHEIPGRGTIIIEPTRRDIEEIYQLREALETFAASMAAERGIDAHDADMMAREVDSIGEIGQRLGSSGRKTLSADLLRRFISADMQFHMHLLEAAGNHRIVKVVANTRLLIRIFTYRREHHTVPHLEQVRSHHQQILNAVRERRADEAARLMREHIRRSLAERLAEYHLDHSGTPEGTKPVGEG